MIVTVSGAHSGAGKTSLIEGLLRMLKGWACLKVTVLHNGACPTGRDCGACEEAGSDFSIVSDSRILEKENKDTQRFLAAGAREVLWLRARPRGLKEGLKKALSKFGRGNGLIIEGTSVLKYINPDLSILVRKKNSVLKPSAEEILKKIDLVITI